MRSATECSPFRQKLSEYIGHRDNSISFTEVTEVSRCNNTWVPGALTSREYSRREITRGKFARLAGLSYVSCTYVRISLTRLTHLFILYICLYRKTLEQFCSAKLFCEQWYLMSTLSYLGIDFMRLTLITSSRQSTTLRKNAVANAGEFWQYFHVQLRVFSSPPQFSLEFHWNLVNAEVTTIEIFHEVFARSNVTKQAISRTETFGKTIIYYTIDCKEYMKTEN